MQRKFTNLRYNRFIQSSFFCNYESELNYLHFKTLYSGRGNLDALYLINVFKNKTHCCSIMYNVGLRVPTKQIRYFSTFDIGNVSRFSLSTGCVTAANNICRSLDVFNTHNISIEGTFSFV
jgi:hypothetical protein